MTATADTTITVVEVAGMPNPEERARVHITKLQHLELDDALSTGKLAGIQALKELREAELVAEGIAGTNDLQRKANLAIVLRDDEPFQRHAEAEADTRLNIAKTRVLIAYHKRLLALEMALVEREAAGQDDAQ